MSDKIVKKLASVVDEIRAIQGQLEALRVEVASQEAATVRVVHRSGRRKFQPQDVSKILSEAQTARELGRGALQIVCKKWGITSSHIHHWEKATKPSPVVERFA